MSKKSIAIAGGVIAATLVLGTAVGAQAHSLLQGKDIANGTITGANVKSNSIAGNDITNGSLHVADLAPSAIAALHGAKGATGATGATGAAGEQGKTGAAGQDGKDGKDAQALPYGIAHINVQRGSGSAVTWESLSTTLGSPESDQANGSFRFSCSAAQAPCKVSVTAYATTSGVTLYPRVIIEGEDYNTGAVIGNTEYADGTDNNGGTLALTGSAQAVPLGIGGTLEANAGQTYPSNGVVDQHLGAAGPVQRRQHDDLQGRLSTATTPGKRRRPPRNPAVDGAGRPVQHDEKEQLG